METSILALLRAHPLRMRLIDHPLFVQLREQAVSKDAATILVEQWYPMLQYFPTYLAKLVAIDPLLARRSVVSEIQNQELGQGSAHRAHETLFLKDLHGAKFDLRALATATKLPATTALVEGYRRSTRSVLRGLGFLYATEVADLAMVSAVGIAIRKATGITRLRWVDIHVQQEPAHVENASTAVTFDHTEREKQLLVHHAQDMWQLWIDFFDNIQKEIARS